MDPLLGLKGQLVLKKQRELAQRKLRRLLKEAPHATLQVVGLQLKLPEEGVAGEAMVSWKEQQVDPFLAPVLKRQRELEQRKLWRLLKAV